MRIDATRAFSPYQALSRRLEQAIDDSDRKKTPLQVGRQPVWRAEQAAKSVNTEDAVQQLAVPDADTLPKQEIVDPDISADFNGDGKLSIFDYIAYGNAFSQKDARADVDRDGSFTANDYKQFTKLYKDASSPTEPHPVEPKASGDFNQDGKLNVFDYIAYGNAFNNKESLADINQDGEFTVDDYKLFGELYKRASQPTEPHPVESSADFDQDGKLNIFDYIAFGNAYSRQDARADLDGDGAFSVKDYEKFTKLYQQMQEQQYLDKE